ncbi:unnamed protein product, partial [Discosporangium mesarthrocarpum]
TRRRPEDGRARGGQQTGQEVEQERREVNQQLLSTPVLALTGCIKTPITANSSTSRFAKTKPPRRVSKEEATQAEGVPLGKDAPAATSGVPAFQGVDELNEMDDWSSAWQDAKENGKAWGGRGKGGRGIQRNTFQPKDIYVEGVTLSYQGVDLLERTTIRLGHGRKYGLVGANGVGKTTLLRRIAAGAVPGWPLHLRSFLVQQEEMVGEQLLLLCTVVVLSC